MQTRSLLARLSGLLFVSGFYCFLYIPIIIFVLFSFNKASFPSPWVEFTFDWYRELWSEAFIWESLYNSFIVSLSAVCLSTIMGVFLVFYTTQGGRVYKLLSQFYLNLVFPEIILAVGLLGFFTFFSIPLGATSLIIAHTVLGLGYMVPIVHARYTELDYRLTEAALDLGASPIRTFFTVTLPLLKPAIYGASILVFIISFDDFVLAYFCAGTSFQTLPLFILSMLRTGVSPVVNALSTLLLVFSSLLIIAYSSLRTKERMF